MATKYVNKLHEKRVLVVGGTSGIGFAVAEASVESGAHVVVASSTAERVKRAVERLNESYPDAGSRIRGHVCDISSDQAEANIRTLFNFATNKGAQKLDHVVDTAGGSLNLVKLSEATPDNVNQLLKSRFMGVVLLAKVAMEYLNPSYTSTFTMTGGVNSTKPMAQGWSIVSGIGSAKEGLTRGLALDMQPVRVNLVSPGAVRTELLEGFAQGNAERLEKMLDFYKEKTIVKRVGMPDDVAESYVYLMKNHFVTGTVLHAEGGYLLA